MRTRVLWLVLLTVAVTALPVSARSAAAKIKEDQKTPATTPESRDGQHDPNKQDEQPKIRVAPSVDLWDGGSARTLAGSTCPVSIPALLSHDAGGRLAPIESWPHAVNFDHFSAEREQRSWLICRYAHAPPLAD